MQIALELATVKDVDTLVAFESKVADPKIYGQPLDFQGALEEINKNTLYLIKMGEMLLGTAAYSLRPDKSIYVSNLAVDPTYRRRGIARTAMLLILEKCKGSHRVDLVTHPENKNALRLYRSLGFKVVSRQENYFGDGEPRLVLALTRALL
jgi:[ribosomal protein S18]-alanine N-acetyltransferase